MRDKAPSWAHDRQDGRRAAFGAERMQAAAEAFGRTTPQDYCMITLGIAVKQCKME